MSTIPVREKPQAACSGVLLAAGRSRRMAGPCKLRLPLGGRPLVWHAAKCLVSVGVSPVFVVLGPTPDLEAALADLPVSVIRNDHPAAGMAGSIAVGVNALPRDASWVCLALGDMPAVAPDTVTRLLRARGRGGTHVVVPRFGERRGHPVLMELERYREPLLRLQGDEGARSLLARCPEDVLEVPVEDEGTVFDVDRARDYERLLALWDGRGTPGWVAGAEEGPPD